MQLNIPTIGDTFVLAEDWTFYLEPERRNSDLRKHCPDWGTWAGCQRMDYEDGRQETWHEWTKRRDELKASLGFLMTLPAGTVLKVERIYIRGNSKGYRRFDSVTFRANAGDRKATHRGRFFAKLADVNKAVFR